MSITRRQLLTGTGAGLLAASLPSFATSGPAVPGARKKLKLGIISDLSGLNADNSQPSLACAQQAIQDFGAANKGMDVEVLVADHQNRVDIASGIARHWFDNEGVDCLVDVSTSNTALAVGEIARAKNKVMLVVGAATPMTGERCSPNTIQWAYDTYMYANVTASAMMKRQGTDSWFILGADYAFGKNMAKDASAVVTKAGGKVLGSIFYPFPGTVDFASYLIQAQSSGAKVLALCQSGADTIGTLKQIREFGLDKTMTPVTMLMYITEIHSMGLETAQGLLFTETFYWDLNERTRSFMKRIKDKTSKNWPGGASAGVYSDTLHYLKVVADMGVDAAKANGAATVARMKAMPTDDDVYGAGWIREDGRKMHDVHLFQVKQPHESTHEWDLMKLITTVSAKDAFKPLADGECPFVPKGTVKAA
jgi:branched-chain amino acid transport system substrate-binding protein